MHATDQSDAVPQAETPSSPGAPTRAVPFPPGQFWTSFRNGTFGALYGPVINEILIGGSLQIPDQGNDTFLRLEARSPDLIPKVTAHAEYNRRPVEDFGDAFILDESSASDARVEYKIRPYLVVGTNCRWTFTRVDKNGGEEVEATSQVFPFVALQLNFGQGAR